MNGVQEVTGVTLSNNTNGCYRCGRPIDNSFVLVNGVSICPICSIELSGPAGGAPGHSYSPAPAISWYPPTGSAITARQLYKAAALVGMIANPGSVDADDIADQALILGNAMADKDGVP